MRAGTRDFLPLLVAPSRFLATSGSFARSGFAALAPAYGERSYLDGRAVVVRDPGGAVLAEGLASGVDDAGRLLVRSAGGSLAAVAIGEATLA